jgi:hypothetical protein
MTFLEDSKQEGGQELGDGDSQAWRREVVRDCPH